MRCPPLTDLPSPPPDRNGWPWTESSPDLPQLQPNGQSWPRISIVTPSYNQGRFIEETIRSVLLQGYPDLEFFIMDGGSADETVAIIKKYDKWITGWVSEKDGGQSAAINKGMARATGEWANWINSDDMLAPGALAMVARAAEEVSTQVSAIVFDCLDVEADGTPKENSARKRAATSIWDFLSDRTVTPQPSTFVRANALKVEERLHLVMDWALYLRLAERQKGSFAERSGVAAFSRSHEDTKSRLQGDGFLEEGLAYLQRFPFTTISGRLAAKRFVIRSRARRFFQQNPPTISWCIAAAIRYPILLGDRIYLGALRQSVHKILGQA